ncbi:MAG: hypothetical protein JWQ34_1108 [Mucilaginibacter sp.]|nr:hypothetical protein [Mucilaginibacter sp.]
MVEKKWEKSQAIAILPFSTQSGNRTRTPLTGTGF